MSDQIINCVHDILCRTDDLKDRSFLEEAIAELARLPLDQRGAAGCSVSEAR